LKRRPPDESNNVFSRRSANTPHIRINRLFGDNSDVWDQVRGGRTRSVDQGPYRPLHGRGRGAERQAEAGGSDRRADLGNTGIGLAMVAAVKGYKLILVMPDSMSVERRRLMLAYGAELRPDAAREGHEGRDRPRRGDRSRRRPNSWMPQQFENPANLEVHRRTTAQEILADFADAPLDVLITGVGTGGHITGCAEVLKKEWQNLKVYRGGADAFARSFPAANRAPPDPGHRRGLHSCDHGYQPP
jgi:cysteine synthase A